MCQSCDNAKDLIAVWMCPCGGVIRPGEENSACMFCVCPNCKVGYEVRHERFCYEGPPWDETFVRVASGAVLPVGRTAGIRLEESEPEPTEHTTPSGVVYVAEREVPT